MIKVHLFGRGPQVSAADWKSCWCLYASNGQ